MSIYGVLEQSAAVGVILGPKAGYEVEIDISVTPTTLNFYASGDMLVSMALVEVEASATVHLLFDFAMGVAEGELYGRIDCDAVVAGLSGEGQLTWHLSNTMQYLQGRGQGRGRLGDREAAASKAGSSSATTSRTSWPGSSTRPTRTSTCREPCRPRSPASTATAAWSGSTSTSSAAASTCSQVPARSWGRAGAPVAAFAGAALPVIVGVRHLRARRDPRRPRQRVRWANLSLRGPVPTYFEGTFGLEVRAVGAVRIGVGHRDRRLDRPPPDDVKAVGFHLT